MLRRMTVLPDALLLLLAGLAAVAAARCRRLARGGRQRPAAADRSARAA
jgi:hypothetical protein